MTIASGEVVPTPGADRPFKIVIRHGPTVLAEYPVGSVADGEALIKDTLQKLQLFAKTEGGGGNA